MKRPTFTAWWILALICVGASSFAVAYGVPQMIWEDDMSMMTSVIAILFIVSVLYLGRQAWLADDLYSDVNAEFGHLSERLCVMAGFVGTAIGLSLQAKSLAGGATSFTALATSLFTTASGGTAAALIAIMTFNLEAGVRRAKR